MRNISIQIHQSLYEIDEARSHLDNLYDHMVYSSGAISEDLTGLDVAIDVLSKVARQLEREKNDGF